MAKYCKHCGAELDEGGRFCPGCGAEVAPPPVQQQSYTPPPAQQQPYTPPPAPQQPYTPPPVQQQTYTPPAPQQPYTPPAPQGQYFVQPKKKSSKLLLIIIIAAAAVAAVIIFINMASDKENSSGDNDTGIVQDDNDSTGATNGADTGSDGSAGGDTDFPNLPLEPPSGGNGDHDFVSSDAALFPWGTWTVNQIISGFGVPEEVIGYFIEESNAVMVMMHYSNATIMFLPAEASLFSYYDSSAGFQETFYIDEKDKNVEMDISSFMVNGPGIALPYGIEVGMSAKSEVVSLYDSEPVFEWSDEDVSFIQYEFPFGGNNGVISYYFDIDGFLTMAMIMSFDY